MQIDDPMTLLASVQKGMPVPGWPTLLRSLSIRSLRVANYRIRRFACSGNTSAGTSKKFAQPLITCKMLGK
jgi:hypothetical protein